MGDINRLPIPDWGLRCPECDAPLAGMPEHRCGSCGRPFSILEVLADQRPIPDIGLTCSRCGYSLTGLTVDRCPECGTEFALQARLEEQIPLARQHFTVGLGDPTDHHVKKRERTFTGNERPLPEFGLCCSHCGSALAGAPADACPECHASFDLLGSVPSGEWVGVGDFVPEGIGPMARMVLYDAQIPYRVDRQEPYDLGVLFGGQVPTAPHCLRVLRSFFFDALHALWAATDPRSGYVCDDWTCPACNEPVPGGFEVCWNCNTPHPG